MNRQLTKKVFIACAVTAMVLTPALAQSREDRGGRGEGAPRVERGERGDLREGPRMFLPEAGFGNGPSVMGTVQSVDAEKGTITVRDADGNARNVHVNPMTRIEKRLPPPPQPADNTAEAPRDMKEKGDRPELPKFGMLDISSITEGSYVSVRNFNTGTDTVEASNIMIVSEQPADA